MASRLFKSIISAQILRPALRLSARPMAVQVACQKPILTMATRCYAKKSKDSKKKSNADSKAIPEDETEDFVRQFNEKQIQERYDNSIDSLKEHLASLRMGRANPCK